MQLDTHGQRWEPRGRRRNGRVSGILAGWLALVPAAAGGPPGGGGLASPAQEAVVVLRTGAGIAFQERVVDLGTVPLLGSTGWSFGFGLATEEESVPGRIPDAFGLSLSAENGGPSAVVYVWDVTGFQALPPTPGGLVLDPAALSLVPEDFPAGLTPLPALGGYQARLALPDEVRGWRVSLRFSLFDNQDDRSTVAYFRGLRVVPEPSPWVLLLLGGAAILRPRRKRG